MAKKSEGNTVWRRVRSQWKLLQLLGSLLIEAGYRSAGPYLSAVKNQHIRLGFPWSDALDLELKEGKKACERGIGPPQKCGASDMQKLADLTCPSRVIRYVQKVQCGRGKELYAAAGGRCARSSCPPARCMQVTFLGGPGCGRCVFNLPVNMSDPQALGKKRTHTCAAQPLLAVKPCVQSR